MQLEWAASALGLVGVALMVREVRVGWLIALLSAGLYAVLYAEQRFYAQMGLNLAYCALQLYGWACWGTAQGARRRSGPLWPWLALGVPASLGLAQLMAVLEGRQVLADATITVYSLIAQIWLAHRRRECWLLFLGTDLGVVAFAYRNGLYPTAALFVAYLGLCVLGWFSWREPAPESPGGPPPSGG